MKQELHPTQIKLIATRGQDDTKELYDLLGTKDYRKELDRQFKNEKSNFKIAIVVDMWLTGFDVPFLDSIYITRLLQARGAEAWGSVTSSGTSGWRKQAISPSSTVRLYSSSAWTARSYCLMLEADNAFMVRTTD
ncbi:MAG: hypothetical protein U5M51_08750 [Emticicia sp.]|nr:hypothetical protein [Emticicia sp.]